MVLEYTDANKLSTVRNASNNNLIARYYYDHGGNRVKKIMYLDSGTKTVYLFNKLSETVVYSNGSEVNYGYDALNPLLSMDYLSDEDLAYTYDLDTTGALSKLSFSNGSLSLKYDQGYRVTGKEHVVDGRSWMFNLTYDPVDHVTQMRYP